MLHCTKSVRRVGLLALGAGLVLGVLPSAALAAPSCLNATSRNSRVELDGFKLDPTRFIGDMRGDTVKISGLVSNFIASDPAMLIPLRQLISYANGEQRRAVGTGLANAAQKCLSTQPSIHSEIAKYVRKLNDPNVTAGFVSMGPAAQIVLPPASRARATTGAGLVEGEDGEKLVDPFAAIPLP